MNEALRAFLEQQLILEGELAAHLRELAEEQEEERNPPKYTCQRREHNQPTISPPELDRT